MGWEKKVQYKNSCSDKLHQKVITAVQWGYPILRSPPVTSRSRRALLLSVVWAIYDC